MVSPGGRSPTVCELGPDQHETGNANYCQRLGYLQLAEWVIFIARRDRKTSKVLRNVLP